MDETTQLRCEARARVLKALGHPVRVCIIEQLEQGEKCVCELAEVAGGDMSTVSKHLAVLRSAGLVRAEKRGLMVFYTLPVPCIMNLFSCIEGVLKNNLREQMVAVGRE